MKRITALALAGLLLFALAGCAPKTQEAAGQESTSDIAGQTETSAPPETTVPEEEETSPEIEETAIEAADTNTAADSTTEPVTDPQAPTAPTGKAEILALYNDAIGKSGKLNRTMYSWDVLIATFANVKIAGIRQDDIDTLETMNKDYRYYRDSQRQPHDLVKLTDAQVASAALKKQDGKLAAYEMQLKPATADQSMPYGYAGYSGLVTWPEIDMLLELASDGSPYTAGIDKFSLSKGKLLVTIDLEGGVIQSAECSFTEDANGPLRLYVVGTATIVLKFEVKSTYKI